MRQPIAAGLKTLVAAAVLMLPLQAMAAPKTAAPKVTAVKTAAAKASKADAEVIQRTNGDYGYVFPDDPLQAVGNDATSVLIKVRSMVVRQTLIRPRVHFVAEMLKSVEMI